MTWLKLKTSEAKKSPRFAKRWVYEQLLGSLLYFSFNFTRVLASPVLKQVYTLIWDKSLVIKLMAGCGKGKYMTKIYWKMPIFASKPLISCIFSENITNFCDFLEKHIYLLIKIFFPWAWKRPKNAQCWPEKGYISCPQVIYFHFSTEKSRSELIFIFSFQNLYLHINFNEKIVHKVVWQNKKTKLKFLVCHR